jgi:hypothetical protein
MTQEFHVIGHIRVDAPDRFGPEFFEKYRRRSEILRHGRNLQRVRTALWASGMKMLRRIHASQAIFRGGRETMFARHCRAWATGNVFSNGTTHFNSFSRFREMTVMFFDISFMPLPSDSLVRT